MFHHMENISDDIAMNRRILSLYLLISILIYYPFSMVVISLNFAMFLIGLAKNGIRSGKFFPPLLLLFLIYLINVKDIDSLSAFRYYYWPIFMVYIIKQYRLTFRDICPGKIFNILWVWILIEAILVNTVVDPRLLPNYPQVATGEWNTNFAEYGTYQRPLGFAGTATASSVLLLISFSLITPKLNLVLKFLLGLLISSSGTGYLLTILYFFKFNVLRIFALCILITFCIYAADLLGDVRVRIGYSYILEILYYKVHQISSQEFNLTTILLGLNDPRNTAYGGYGGDFSVLGMISYFGLIGLLPYIYISLKFQTIYKKQIIFLLFASLHYGVVFSYVGTLLYGLLYNSTEGIGTC